MAINVGGPAMRSVTGINYVADQYFVGGDVGSSTAAVDNTLDDSIFQNERWGDFSYAIPLTNGDYDVTLQFNEIYWTSAGNRAFGVTLEGAQTLLDFDIFQVAGAKNKALEINRPSVQVRDGVLNLTFNAASDWATLSGIVIKKAAAATQNLAMAINVGGPAYTASNGITYVADRYFTGGNVASSASEVANTSDDPIYRDERWGSFNYSIPMANGRYDVILQFNELYWTSIGSRRFGVTIEASNMLYDFDIFRLAGSNTALDLNFGNIQVSDGVLNLHFQASVDAASLSGIVVKRTPNLLDSGSSSSTSSSSSSGSTNPTGDAQAPSVPGNVKVSNLLNKQLTLSWAASTDNVGVTAYYIYRDGTQVGYVGGSVLSYTDQALSPDTRYNYTVKAKDAAGNYSLASQPLDVKTLLVAGKVTLTWMQPTERYNGEKIYATDIGGYEVRYKLRGATTYSSVKVPASTTSYTFTNLSGDYDFEVSVYDTAGVSSEFVRATR